MVATPDTLHDFVLDLLSNPSALAAFQVDAEGCLAAAGLSDVTALDVQEVIPLVLDFAPSAGLPALDGIVAGDLDLDLEGSVSAIAQLQAVTQQLTGVVGAGSDLNLGAVGALTADASGVGLLGGTGDLGLGLGADVATSVDATVATSFSAVGDVTATLDGATTAVTQTAAGVDTTVDATLSGAVDTLDGTVGSALPGLDGVTSPLFDTVGSVHGSVSAVADQAFGALGGGGLDLGATLEPVGDLTQHVTATVSATAHNAGVGGVTDAVGHATAPIAESPLGDLLF
ncbi:IniB N-terminal domain-containing protein [Actinosynnema pretiosum subsp. pretiosum]|uniref:IniB N-terminal domain-containing protein n=1 Tax=Actinosynnema pretiosum subsp. pretiosum TaxID=103721 RepID=A0AA45R191_9PSEU|nr:PE-PGRS family protein [Actinosynnema pretiosum subsp. pretiosum]QUF01426.1 IniB N-terminal domain-containing protein [Actinosynnema pretiosum subsp. pretiosum]